MSVSAAIHRTEVVIQPEDIEKEQEMKPVEEAPTQAAEAPKPEEAPEVPTETPQAEELVAPLFTTLLQPQQVEDGQRVVLTVRFIGRPSPRITWYQNGVELKPNPDFEIFVDHTKGESTLIIVEVFPEDEGEYTCIAVNEVGESITTCRLTVISKWGFFLSDLGWEGWKYWVCVWMGWWRCEVSPVCFCLFTNYT